MRSVRIAKQCERDDDSHGNWGTCEEGAEVTTDMCEHYSFPYYRDRLAATGEFLHFLMIIVVAGMRTAAVLVLMTVFLLAL